MSLSVSPRRAELLAFEISTTRTPTRPSLLPLSSFSSFSSSNSTTSTPSSAPPGTSRALTKRPESHRPSLTPDDFLTHAFGVSYVSARKQLAPTSPTDSSTSNAGSSDISISSGPPDEPFPNEKHYYPKYDSIPAPPPRGTFRSAKKSSKDRTFMSGGPTKPRTPLQHDLSLSITELNPLCKTLPHPGNDNNLSLATTTQRPIPAASREPPMTKAQWREKAEQRAERRKLRRIAFALDGTYCDERKLPLDIDCRPMEGELGLPPGGEQVRLPRGRPRVRAVSLERGSDEEEALEKRSKSMVGMDALAKHCAALTLDGSVGIV